MSFADRLDFRQSFGVVFLTVTTTVLPTVRVVVLSGLLPCPPPSRRRGGGVGGEEEGEGEGEDEEEEEEEEEEGEDDDC